MILASFALVGVLLTRNYLVFGLALLTGVNLAALRVFLRRTERKTAEARQKNEQLAKL